MGKAKMRKNVSRQYNMSLFLCAHLRGRSDDCGFYFLSEGSPCDGDDVG